ncbi:hypothetical protein GJ496_003313, partial [Pomphorhynchus laevis]
AMTLKHRQCFNASRISSQIEEIKFSGCQINMKDYFGLDNLTYIELESTVLTDFDLLYGTTGASTISILSSNIASMDFLYRVKAPSLTHLSLSGNIIEELNFAIFKSIPNVQYLNLSFNRIVVIAKAQLPNTYNLKSLDLRGNRIQLISDFIYLFNKSTDYLNMIQNNNQTEGRFADYLEYSILPIFDVQIDYNLSLPVSNLIYHSALPKVLCLHSTCIPGKHIELVARSQGIGNPYGVTCPAMYSKYNEFKNLKINRPMSNTELLAKHVLPCIEYMEVIDQTGSDYSFIPRMVHYNLKSLSLINASGIDIAIERMPCCKSLSKLDMSFNRIKEFTKLYDILLNTKLQILNLSFNEIEYLNYVNENTSIILSKSILEVLDLSNNKLTRLAIEWVLTPSLRILNCSYNQIRYVYFDEALLYGNGRQLSALNLANNQHFTFEGTTFDSLTGLTEIDLSDTNLSSYSLLENVANLCKIYLNRNSLWEYVRFTCKYNSEYEIYLSGNHIQKANSVRMFYTTRVLDISHNLLEDLLGSDCEDISHTKILNVSSNMIANIDENFPQIMTLLEELDL